MSSSFKPSPRLLTVLVVVAIGMGCVLAFGAGTRAGVTIPADLKWRSGTVYAGDPYVIFESNGVESDKFTVFVQNPDGKPSLTVEFQWQDGKTVKHRLKSGDTLDTRSSNPSGTILVVTVFVSETDGSVRYATHQ